MFVLTGLTAVFRHSKNPLTAQLFATLDISLSADTLMMPHQSPYRGVTLGIMMVEGAFVSRLGLLLFLDSVSPDGNAPPALQRDLCGSWRTSTFPSGGQTRLLFAFVGLHTWMYSVFMSLQSGCEGCFWRTLVSGTILFYI